MFAAKSTGPPDMATAGKPTFYVVMGMMKVLKDENLAKKRKGLLAYTKSVLERYPECRESWAAQDLENDRIFHLYQQWDSKEHFKAACKLEPRRLAKASSGYDLDHDEGVMLTYLTCHQFPLPDSDVPKSPLTHWAYMDSMTELTVDKETGQPTGELFLLTLKGKGGQPDAHALYNNTPDKQFLAKMRFPGQKMIPILEQKLVRKCKIERGEGRTPAVAFEASVLPGHTVPFVKGTFTGKYGFSYRHGPPVDEEFLDGVAEKMQKDIAEKIDEFKAFLRKHMHTTPELKPPPPGQVETRADMRLYNSDEFIAAATNICVKHDGKYVDLSWQPSQQRISRTASHPPEPPAPVRGWMRPEGWLEDPKDDFALIRDEAEPGDIDQGELGDCWFMASIAACAEAVVTQQLVTPMFLDISKRHDPEYLLQLELEQKAGFFRICMAKHGRWKWHVIDTFLPVTPVKAPSGPCFAHNRKDPREMWVAMLEKVYAKICGSYQAISGGDPAVALCDLTGYPCRTFDWHTDDGGVTLFRRYLYHDHKDRMLWVTTPGQDTSAYMNPEGQTDSAAMKFAQMYEDIGLVTGHAYTVVHAVEWPDEEAAKENKRQPVRLLNIRNPWGSELEWNGMWSDQDEAWSEPANEEIAALCAQKEGFSTVKEWTLWRTSGEAGDGAFWMQISDVIKFFNGGGVCMRCEPSWQDLRFGTRFEDGFPKHIIKVIPTITCDCFIFAQQVDKRGRLDEYREQCALRMEVLEPVPGKPGRFSLLATSFRKKNTETGEALPGRYVRAHCVTAFEHGAGRGSRVDAVRLYRGKTYYLIVRQYPNEEKQELLNRDHITQTILSSRQAGEPLRGITVYEVDEDMKKAFRFQEYYGMDTSKLKPTEEIFCQLNREQVWPRDGTDLSVSESVKSVLELRRAQQH